MWVYAEKLAQLVGTTPKAITHKRQRGQLPEGEVWVRDGKRYLYNTEGWNRWASRLGGGQSASRSRGMASDTESDGQEAQPWRTSAKPSAFKVV